MALPMSSTMRGGEDELSADGGERPHGSHDSGPHQVKILYIVGDARCGSTLLQHLMARQAGVCALGEVQRLGDLVRQGQACVCGRQLNECSFWSSVASRLGLPLDSLATGVQRVPWQSRWGTAIEIGTAWLGHGALARTLLRREGAVARCCLAIDRVAGLLTGSAVVVDSSKIPSHFLHMYLAAPAIVSPIFLVRDGRGIVWSKMKRSNIDAEEAISRWLRSSRMLLAVRQLVAPPMRKLVHYEELCRNPRQVLEQILGRTGLAVQAPVLGAMMTQRHDLGGSPRFRGREMGKIELDQRWRSEMPEDVCRVFERRGRSMNQRLGYA